LIVLVRLMDDYYFLLITQGGGTVIKKLDEIEAGKVMSQEGEVDFRKIFGGKFRRKL
jgi:flagellar protein FliO/FliZ